MAVSELKNGKATGRDQIQPILIKKQRKGNKEGHL
jgi:hypothetical protein